MTAECRQTQIIIIIKKASFDWSWVPWLVWLGCRSWEPEPPCSPSPLQPIQTEEVLSWEQNPHESCAAGAWLPVISSPLHISHVNPQQDRAPGAWVRFVGSSKGEGRAQQPGSAPKGQHTPGVSWNSRGGVRLVWNGIHPSGWDKRSWKGFFPSSRSDPWPWGALSHRDLCLHLFKVML